jgi:beta propeller repeat protein
MLCNMTRIGLAMVAVLATVSGGCVERGAAISARRLAATVTDAAVQDLIVDVPPTGTGDMPDTAVPDVRVDTPWGSRDMPDAAVPDVRVDTPWGSRDMPDAAVPDVRVDAPPSSSPDATDAVSSSEGGPFEPGPDGGTITDCNLAAGQGYAITTNAAVQVSAANWGNYIAWVDKRHGSGGDIHLLDLASCTETRVTSVFSAKRELAMSGGLDSSGNPFARLVWTDQRNGYSDIYVWDTRSGKETRLTDEVVYQSQPAVSGDRIVWQDSRHGYSDIYWVDLFDGVEIRLTSGDATYDYLSPSISGNRVVWVRHNKVSGDRDIVVHHRTLVEQSTEIIALTGDQDAPAVSGERIVWRDFSGTCGSSSRLRMRDNDGTVKCLVTAAGAHLPAISGSRVVWVDQTGLDVYVLGGPQPSAPLYTTGGPTSGERPSISGYRLVWSQTIATPQKNIDIWYHELPEVVLPEPVSPCTSACPTVGLTDPTTGTSGAVEVSFQGSVDAPGDLTLESSEGAGAPPLAQPNFAVGDPPTYYEVSFSGTFSGSLELCFDYSGVAFRDESNLSVLHYDTGSGTWQPLTITSHSPQDDRICASSTSLSPFVVVEPTALTVSIDLNPCCSVNIIHLGPAGLAQVAIHSQLGFDATQLDIASLRLSGASVSQAGVSKNWLCKTMDSNGDGLADLVCLFNKSELTLDLGVTEAVLEGKTQGQGTVRGRDTVIVSP